MDDLDMFSSTIDLDFDFDIGDFDILTNDNKPKEETTQQRILKPRIDRNSIDTRMVSYENAKQFVRDLDIENNFRVFAWVDGSFIFGEIPEALGDIGLPVRKAWISSLGLNEENIDSLYNCIALYGLEKLSLLLSAYFYSHEKNTIIPYMLDKLDLEIENDEGVWEPCFQVGYFNMHAKIMCLELFNGTKLTIHGSSNLRSSSCIEQMVAETDPDLFDFNVGLFREFMRRYYTINHTFGAGKRIKPL